jgi:undecaprenyl-phosphate 4-deoxy-4-formamido-L-arabinose transferase
MIHNISIVIPIYRGQNTLTKLVSEIDVLTKIQKTSLGNNYKVTELLLVHDCGPDDSHKIIVELEKAYFYVRPIWLSRNFGQHAATLAGMASATGDWVLTMDEDGQHNPNDVSNLLDMAVINSLQIVYAAPLNTPPHGFLRNYFSKIAKKIVCIIIGNTLPMSFNSFRLVEGEIARNLAAYSGAGVYLDIGLLWITANIGQSPVSLRNEYRPKGNYSYTKLISHFWKMILTIGTRPLRFITLIGMCSIVLGIFAAVFAIYGKINGYIQVQGWTSLLIAITFFSGVILASLGLIAEYLAVTLSIAMGKPLYVVTSHPTGTLYHK